MKIGFVTAFPPERDGIADYSFHLISSIEKLNSDCTFYVLARDLSKKHPRRKVDMKKKFHINRTTLYRVWTMRSMIDSLKSIIAVIRIIMKSNIDIIHFQYRFTRDQGGTAGEPFLFLMLIAKGLLRRVKIVVSLHDFWLPVEAERRAYELTKSGVMAKIYKFYYAAYIRIALGIPNLVISLVNSKNSPVSGYIKKYTKKEVLEILHGYPRAAVPLSSRKKTPIRNSMHARDCFTILLFGFIRRAKAYHHVIKAVKKALVIQPTMKEKIKLLIAGIPSSQVESLYLDYLRKLIEKLNLEGTVVIMERFLSDNEIDTLFSNTDVTVIPYARRVGPSGVLSFALAYEVPAVATLDKKYITPNMDFPAITVNLNEDDIATVLLKLANNQDLVDRQIARIKEFKRLNSNREIASTHLELYRRLLH